MTDSMTSVITRPNSGVFDDIALDRLHAEVQHRRRTADALVPASRRAARTLDAMRDRLPLPPLPAFAATEEDLNRELEDPGEGWDQAVPPTVLPQAAGGVIFGDGRVGVDVAMSVSCPDCGGEGGRMHDTSDGGVLRQTWHTCSTCRGTGTLGQ